MNSNKYTVSRLNHKRKIYNLTDTELDKRYHDLALFLKRTHPHLSNRNRALKQVVRSLTPRLYNMHSSQFVGQALDQIIWHFWAWGVGS